MILIDRNNGGMSWLIYFPYLGLLPAGRPNHPQSSSVQTPNPIRIINQIDWGKERMKKGCGGEKMGKRMAALI
jgi:hypothetical protein